ncbi:Peptide methionine sulfoxide reductase MsrA 1 [Delftia tsuruhatensis]|uniref:peptide-methionine (S)-S-oxide reductase MsrA n=1 Tax=Delftia tsuruhatensis TaxID=180282 RepID=UPI001E7F9DC0|nr:peptide-methionine (S)-S-oxide reductase MsrA [Delftia tsuruhatensis]CAB5712030.1 Peptide methionine sulfoxide reductase MsrA 1 [Delftia tsuruhatensis]CAC9682229.1 Peptide methionine sulfoxide reductase MsrA 1 [Delftia tsuruhatensis]
MNTPSIPRRRGLFQLLAGSAVLLGGAALWQGNRLLAAEQAVRIPPPAQDAPASGQGPRKAIFAGGCFWGVQGVFQHVKGVQRVVSGYSGGTADQASYAAVSSGRTGHAESVEITYDPAQVSYGRLLQIFFSVAHDPTQLNRQGPDTGTQYRSAIFASDADQLRTAQAYVAQLEAAKAFGKPIVTQLEGRPSFFPAETYHQDFMTENPRHPYIVINDLPKVEQLRQWFPDQYRADPVLVKQAAMRR